MIITNAMKTPYSHAEQYIAQLKGIEQKINQNQLQEAVQQLNQLGKTSQNDPRLFLLASRLSEASGNPEGMLQAARKAHQLAPHWATSTMHLAAVLASRGESEEAIAMAALAVQQAPNDVGLLSRCAELALRFNLLAQALQWLRQAESLDPDNASIRYKIGLTLSTSGDYAGAIDIFTAQLLQLPNNTALLSARMQACLGAKQIEQAIQDGEALVSLEPDNESHPFYLAIARGETPSTQPASVVTALFDGHAAQFDRHWVVQLKYKLPRDVAKMIHQWHADLKGDVLDLGCGTGLLGACLGRTEGVLVGVDLSDDMLVQAQRHNVYDSFHNVNLLDALRDTPEGLYNVITALDVLIYVGDLSLVIANAHRILVPGGRFVFSCEAGAEGEADYVLPGTYRYTHQRRYVQRLLDEAGFKDVEIEDRVLRYEADEPVQGFLVIARKPIKAAGKTARRSPKSAKPAPLAQ